MNNNIHPFQVLEHSPEQQAVMAGLREKIGNNEQAVRILKQQAESHSSKKQREFARVMLPHVEAELFQQRRELMCWVNNS